MSEGLEKEVPSWPGSWTPGQPLKMPAQLRSARDPRVSLMAPSPQCCSVGLGLLSQGDSRKRRPPPDVQLAFCPPPQFSLLQNGLAPRLC